MIRAAYRPSVLLSSLLALSLLACGDKENTGDDDDDDDDDEVIIDEDGDGSPAEEDCDDADAENFPGNTEVCDEADNNCDGVVDEDVKVTFYADGDSDGYGDVANTSEACEAPAGSVLDGTDCDDTNAAVSPGAIETCNGVDDDCNGTIDDEYATDAETWYTDSDGDTYGDPETEVTTCTRPANSVDNGDDCRDTLPDVNPDGTETCNGLDDDCNGTLDDDYATDAQTWYVDGDSDGYGDDTTGVTTCTQPSGTILDNTDCDDTVDTTNPGADETCNSVDDDCNGTVDDTYATDAGTWYADADSDGFGDPDAGTVDCTQPSDTVTDATDCDDTDAAINPDRAELCNGVDDDCDATTSEDGMATWVDSSGGYSDVTSTFSVGASGAPVAYTASSDGALWFCDGTWYTNLTLEADVTVAGPSGDASATILDGDDAAPVITIATDGVDVAINDLTLQAGYATETAITGEEFGGGILCEVSTSATLSLDGVIVTDSSAEYGGGIGGIYCDVSLSNSEISDNYAGGTGGGMYLIYGDMVLDNVDLIGNSAYDVGGWYLDSGVSVTATDVLINDNYADSTAGGAYLTMGTISAAVTLDELEVSDNLAESIAGIGFYGGDITWTGTATTTSGVMNNDGTDAGGLYLSYATLDATLVDFGTNSGGDDNAPVDIYNGGNGFDYMAGDDATFTCDDTACGTSVATTSGGALTDFGDESLWGDVFLADTTATIDSFEIYLAVANECTALDYFIFESTDLTTWELIWKVEGITAASEVYNDTGDIGFPVVAGTYYMLGFASDDCEPEFQWSSTGTSTSNGFGTGYGFALDYGYEAGEFSIGDTTTDISVDTRYAGTIWNMITNTTEL
jgi:hypothetical protein